MNTEEFGGRIHSSFDPIRAAVVELRQRGINTHYVQPGVVEVKYTNGV